MLQHVLRPLPPFLPPDQSEAGAEINRYIDAQTSFPGQNIVELYSDTSLIENAELI